MKILVTGHLGFVGSHLCRLVKTSYYHPAYQLVTPLDDFDLVQSDSVDRTIHYHRPDIIVHLAAQSFVPKSFEDPEGTFQVNLLGTLRLLQSLTAIEFKGVFLYVSSGDVYGTILPERLPVGELHAVCPQNPYAVSKVATELLCKQWAMKNAFKCITVRPFNHIGAGQSDDFFVSSIGRQIARMKLGKQQLILDVGDIDVTRDFLDVEDVIAAYLLLIGKGFSGEVYNVCSGQEYLLRDLVEGMAAIAGVKVEIRQDQARMRVSDQRRVCGSNMKLSDLTGWKPKIKIEESLKNIVDYWVDIENDK